jgi:hypothetical protein
VASPVDVDLETWWKNRVVDRSGVRHEDDRESGPSLIVEQSPFAYWRLDVVSIGEWENGRIGEQSRNAWMTDLLHIRNSRSAPMIERERRDRDSTGLRLMSGRL